ncbi:hypothetical protein [Halanaerobium hydrogeniformans]|uniref:hypothetical protein n=1 Tax=Halanaerobium hydrogeniformans TaxID=656519 RepID=UPI0005A21D86|nr:hypothetical protein [Halanaerobium hydrogeniformans]
MKNANDTEKACILAHEIAHELLHIKDNKNKSKLTKEVREMEAEAVSFVVIDCFGIETKSEKYLALYKKIYDLMNSLKKISKMSEKMIDYILEQLKLKEK